MVERKRKGGKEEAASPPPAPKAAKPGPESEAATPPDVGAAAPAASSAAAGSALNQNDPGAVALAAAQGCGQPPFRPEAEAPVEVVEPFFQKYSVWVHSVLFHALKTRAPGLRSTLFENKKPHQIGALPIQAHEKNEQSMSFKAPWSVEHARIALGTTGRFEAGSNIMWLTVCPGTEKARTIAGDSLGLEQLDGIEEQFFTVKVLHADMVRGERRWERLIFPDTLPVAVDDKAFLLNAEFWFMTMPLLRGHCYVQAWYLAMGKALQSWMASVSETARNDALTHVACLLECALTATVHAKDHHFRAPEEMFQKCL